MPTPNYILDALKKACDALGGTVEQRGIENVCVVRPHDKATLEIKVVDGKLHEVSGWNDTANINVIYTGGQPIISIKSNKEKAFSMFTMHGGNTCSFERLSRIVKGYCVVDGKVVSFSIDP